MAAALTSGHSRWLVVLSSFIMYFLVHCSLRALPILYVELVDIFQAGKSATAWVPALQEFMFKGSGVLVAPFIKKFGCRAVAMVGTVIAAGGYIGGMFSSNIVELVFSVGFTAGIGMGMMILSSLICVQYHFEDKRALASSLAIVGNSVGTLSGSPFTRVMIEEYSWTGALFIQAGILVNGLVASLLLLPKPKRPIPPTSHGTPTEEFALRNVSKQRSYSANAIENVEPTEVSASEVSDVPRAEQSNGSVAHTTATENTQDQVDDEEKKTIWELLCASIRSLCSRELIHNTPFMIYIISNIFIFFGYIVPITFLPERAVHLGIGKLDAAFLISIIAISNIATRLGVGFIQNETVRFWIYVGIGVCSGFVNLLTPVYNVYWALCLYSVLLGLCHGSFLPLKVVIVVDLAGTIHVEAAVAWSFACVSVPVLFGPPLAGALIQATQNYELPFMLAGGSQLLGAMILLAIPVLRRTRANYTRITNSSS